MADKTEVTQPDGELIIWFSKDQHIVVMQVPDSELEFVHVICQSQQIEEDFGGDSGHCCVLAADVSEILLVQEVLVHGRLLELNSSEEVDDKVEVVPLLALLIDLLLEVHLMQLDEVGGCV